jgi:hypothetical protein
MNAAKDGSKHQLAYSTQTSQCGELQQDIPSPGHEELKSQPCPEGIPL